MDLTSLVKEIQKSQEWNPDLLEELCEKAGMSAEWEAADGESFEKVAYAAAKKLGVSLHMTNQEAQNMKWYITFSDGTGKGEKGVPTYYFSTKSGEKEIPGNLVSRWFHIEPFIEAAQSGAELKLTSQDIDSREADKFYIYGIAD